MPFPSLMLKLPDDSYGDEEVINLHTSWVQSRTCVFFIWTHLFDVHSESTTWLKWHNLNSCGGRFNTAQEVSNQFFPAQIVSCHDFVFRATSNNYFVTHKSNLSLRKLLIITESATFDIMTEIFPYLINKVGVGKGVLLAWWKKEETYKKNLLTMRN